MTPRILIIDDEEMIQRLYRDELQRDGYAVDTAGSGQDALIKAALTSYDVIVLDIELPDMSGLEVLQKLRLAAPTAPIVINTAYAVYRTDFQSWLADDYIVKSSDIGPLRRKIGELVSVR
ncbi:MAG TPA: response regulator [Candidatus Deferrimicrobium sp.]|nr:response regulator [Candidatus Deferrimicrobium sp.]